MLLWYQTEEEGQIMMTLFDERFATLAEAVKAAEILPSEKFQITQNTRILNGTRIWGEILWRMEGSTRPFFPTKY